MPRQLQGSQFDFSYGEVDVDLKRRDNHPARKGGLRQMSNARIHNSGTIQNRSGRRMLFIAALAARTEEVTMSPGNLFKLAFGTGFLNIFNSAGAIAATFNNQGGGAALPWSSATISNIVYARFGLSIYITFPGMQPQVLTWDGASTWTIAAYAEAVVASGQKRTAFYRLSPQNVTMKPSATTGNITLIFSSNITDSRMVGTRMRYAGRQVLITGWSSSAQLSALVIEPLPPAQTITFTSNQGNFAIGDVVLGSSSGAEGIVISAPSTQTFLTNIVSGTFNVGDSITGGTSGATAIITSLQPWQGITSIQYTVVSLSTGTAFVNGETITSGGGATGTVSGASTTGMLVQLLATSTSLNFFAFPDTVVGPSGSGIIASAGTAVTAPQAISDWDDEIMNGFRGWPASCFVDQYRVGFCNFPAIPNGIAWSAINSAIDLYVGGPTVPNGAMFELAPDKVQIYYVVPGPESSEFVFCDHKLYYIKIDATNPLRPGSVGFQALSGDGASRVQPRVSQDFIFYVNAGGNSVMAVTAPGAYYRPFNTRNMTEFHSHLFSNIVALAAPNADGTFNERYLYALNANGTMACGKYNARDGQLADDIGWGPWSGAGAVSWIAATNADIIFTTNYFGTNVCEVLDDTVYMDASLFVNAAPTALAPPGGKGPLWMLPGQSVFLMDQVSRPMGIYQVDANGFIIPQNNGGENLLAASLMAGQIWSGAAEPFAPDAPSGADQHQRMELRQFSKFAVYVIHSTGLVFNSLFSGKQTRLGKVPGSILNTTRRPAYNMDDDTTVPPYQRETVESWTPPGSSYDPRCAVAWDTPGPIEILEFAMEISP